MKSLFYYSLLSLLVLSGCSSVETTDQNTSGDQSQPLDSLLQSAPKISLTSFKDSDFLQVKATFYVKNSRQAAFKVISDLSLTTQWFDRLSKIETLKLIDSNHFILRSVINPPFPFKDRELITCVNTQFAERLTTIDIKSCNDELKEDHELVRVKKAESQWQILEQNTAARNITKIHYQAWIDPAGNVPSFFFNQSLKNSTLKSLTTLKDLINNTDENTSYY